MAKIAKRKIAKKKPTSKRKARQNEEARQARQKRAEILKLIPLIDACSIPDDVDDELNSCEILTHYQNGVFSVDWDDDEDSDDHWTLPVTRAWLLMTHGEDIKQYTSFGLLAT